MTREQAIEKIKKLQALKEGASKISSEGEAEQASKAIDRLQKEFGITMEEVYASASNDEEKISDEEQNRRDNMQSVYDHIFRIFYKTLFVNKIGNLDVFYKTRIKYFDDYIKIELPKKTKLINKCQNLRIDIYAIAEEARKDAIEQLDVFVTGARKDRTKYWNEELSDSDYDRDFYIENGKFKLKKAYANSSNNTDWREKKIKVFGVPVAAGVLLIFFAVVFKNVVAHSVPERKSAEEIATEVESGEKSVDDLTQSEKMNYDAFKEQKKVGELMGKKTIEEFKKAYKSKNK